MEKRTLCRRNPRREAENLIPVIAQRLTHLPRCFESLRSNFPSWDDDWILLSNQVLMLSDSSGSSKLILEVSGPLWRVCPKSLCTPEVSS